MNNTISRTIYTLDYINNYYNYYIQNSDKYNDYTKFELYHNKQMNIHLFQNIDYLYYFLLFSYLFQMKKIKMNMLSFFLYYYTFNYSKNYYFNNYDTNNIINKIFITRIIRNIFSLNYMSKINILLGILISIYNIKFNNRIIQKFKNILVNCIYYYLYTKSHYIIIINQYHSITLTLYNYKVIFFLQKEENTNIYLNIYFFIHLLIEFACCIILLVLFFKFIVTIKMYINLIITSYQTFFRTFITFYNFLNNSGSNRNNSSNNLFNNVFNLENNNRDSNRDNNRDNRDNRNINNIISETIQTFIDQDVNRNINNRTMNKQLKIQYKKLDMESVNKKLDDINNDKCIICFENDIDTIFNKCNHNCVCLNCAHKLSACPICREDNFDIIYYY